MICPVCGRANGHDPMSFCGWKFVTQNNIETKEEYLKGRQETSQEAWDDIRKNLSTTRMHTLVFLQSVGKAGCTGGEANYALAGGQGNPSYHRRLSELVDLGFAVRTEKRKCSISGKSAWAYAITKKGLDVLGHRGDQ